MLFYGNHQRYTPIWMDGWTGGWMDGWVDGWADGWMDGWVGRWMDVENAHCNLFLLSKKSGHKPKSYKIGLAKST
jgi:hypothetical protein